jgi:WD40 repeat protein
MASRETQRRSPYQGLIPYGERDAPFFFGREKEARLITANLFASPLTLLYGASGVGKSSVLRAGVAHQLRTREDLLIVVFNSWQGNPGNDLIQAISDQIKIADQGAWERIKGQVSRNREMALNDYLAICADELQRRLMIILDQFEEYFLYHPVEDSFATAFSKAITSPKLPVSFLISIREDFYAKLDRFEGRIPSLYDNYFRIEHLDRHAARTAIEKPIAEYNRRYASDGLFTLEPDLVGAVLAQVETGQVIIGEAGRGVVEGARHSDAEARIETPFLQLVMMRLWDTEVAAGSHRLRLETLTKLGGAANIVRTHLDAVVSKLSPREQEIAASIFHYLVTPSGTKVAYTAADLAGSAELEEAEVVEVLERLTHGDVRILRPVDPTRERPGVPRYEIFHDVLAPAILAWRTNYAQAQERAEANEQLAREAAEREKAVRQLEREQALARRLRFALVGMAVLLVLMFAVTGYAFYQRRQAKGAELVAQMARSEALKQRDAAKNASDEAVRQRDAAKAASDEAVTQRDAAKAASAEAVKQRTAADQSAAAARAAQQKEAEQRQQTQHALDQVQETLKQRDAAELARQQQESINKLRTDVEVARGPLETRPTDSLSQAKSVLSKLSQLGIKDPESAGRAEDVLRRALLALDESPTKNVLRGHKDSVDGAFFSPEGNLLVTTGDEGVARVWDTHDWHEINSLTLGDQIRKVVFNRDGSQFITLSGENNASVWDKDSLYAPVRQLKGSNATFGLDGKTIFLTDKGKVYKWSSDTGEPVEVPHTPPLNLRHAPQEEQTWISSDGTIALSVGNGGGVEVWEIGTKRPQLHTKVDMDPKDVVFNTDGTSVAVFGRTLDGNNAPVNILDIRKWRQAPLVQPTPIPSPSQTPSEEPAVEQPETKWVTLLTAGKSEVVHAEFNPATSDSLLTLSADGTTLLWDVHRQESVPILPGQTADVINAIFNPDGKYVVLLGSRGTTRLWSVEKRALFATLRGHEGPVLNAAFSPRDGSLVTASYDKTARVWEWQPNTWRADPTAIGNFTYHATAAFSEDGRYILARDAYQGAQVWPAEGGENPLADFTVDKASFSADGRLIALAGKVPVVRLLDAATAQAKSVLSGHTGEVRLAVFSDDGRYVLAASADRTARVSDVKTGTAVVLGGLKSEIVAAAFSPDAKQLVTIDQIGTSRVWQWQTEEGRTHPLVVERNVSSSLAAVSPDGNLFATTPGRGSVFVWETHTGKRVAEMKGHRSQIKSIAFSPDSKRLISVEDYGVRELNLATAAGQSIEGRVLVVDKRNSNWTGGLPGRGAAFSPDSRFVLTGGGRLVQLWDVTTTDAPRRIAFADLEDGSVLGVAYSPTGNYIAAADGRGTLHVWKAPAANAVELKLGDEIARLPGMPLFRESNRSENVSFSADEKVIFASDKRSRAAVWTWLTPTGPHRPVFFAGNVTALSPDGRLVFSAAQSPVIRVQEATATPQGTPTVITGIDRDIERLVLSPDGGTVAAEITRSDEEVSHEVILLYDSKSGTRRAGVPLADEEPVKHIRFSPDSRLLAVANRNRLLLFDAKDGAGIPLENQANDELGGHKGDIRDVEFSPDSKYIITASADRTARVWGIAAGKAVLLLRGHFGEVTSASFSRDGAFIVTTSTDKTARVWQWRPPEQAGALAQLVGEPVVLEGHAGSVLTAAFDHDRRFVVTGSADNTARLWNARTGQVLAELVGHPGDVSSVQFGPDGKSILTVGANGPVQVYVCHECGRVEELLAEANKRIPNK